LQSSRKRFGLEHREGDLCWSRSELSTKRCAWLYTQCANSHRPPDSTYGCESWTLWKDEETRLDAFEMKGLRKVLRISWTAKKTNEWVLNRVGVKRELLDTVKARKLAYCGHTMRKQGSCLEKEMMQGTMPGARRRGRQRTAWMDNIKTWTGLSVEESIRMTEDRDKWRKYVHGVDRGRLKNGTEQPADATELSCPRLRLRQCRAESDNCSERLLQCSYFNLAPSRIQFTSTTRTRRRRHSCVGSGWQCELGMKRQTSAR